jgi:2-amino-4-hydroxy-6-hydroxymethyldihydropteridine diphosphokinase
MQRAFISIGSNIHPAANIRKAVHSLRRRVQVTGLSTVYCTKAIDRPDEPDYFNCVLEIMTGVSPEDLQCLILRVIENDLGRIRSEDKYAARTIDLDLILYGEMVIASAELIVPDPEILERPFLAIALHELDQNLIIPGISMPIKDIVGKFQESAMKPLENYTTHLRKDIRYGCEYRQDKRINHRVVDGYRRRPPA